MLYVCKNYVFRNNMSDRKVVRMEVIYNGEGVPIAIINGTAYFFDTRSAQVIVGELVLDESLSNSIKNNLIDYINEKLNEVQVNHESSPKDLVSFIRAVMAMLSLGTAIDIIEDADNTRTMLSTYKPYNSWHWDKEKRSWEAPQQYPSNAPEGVYEWSEDVINWVPALPKPYESWIWNEGSLEYMPPVPYPIDADPDEFIWDEQKTVWVAND